MSVTHAGSPKETRVLADRIGGLTGEGAFEIAAAARKLKAAGRDVIQLAIGEPDFAPPPRVVDEAVRALHAGDARYGPPEGLPALREAIASSLRSVGIAAASEQVVVTPGAKPALAFALLSLVHPGDAVLVPDPGFPIYASLVRFAGGVPVPYSVAPDGEPLPDDIALARLTPRARVVIVNSPHNPTGAVASRAGLERLADAALRHDLVIISDEVYARLVYAEPDAVFDASSPAPRQVRAPSIAEIPELADRTVVIDSFSKTWAMTGFRLGYGSFPLRLARAASLLSVNVHSCVPAFVQRAGLAALDEPEDYLHARRAELRRRRDTAVRALREIPGVDCAEPNGAFYVFPSVEQRLLEAECSSEALCSRLLDRDAVALLPGSAFGRGGEGAIRIALTTSGERIANAIDKLSHHLDEPGSVARVLSARGRAHADAGGGVA